MKRDDGSSPSSPIPAPPVTTTTAPAGIPAKPRVFPGKTASLWYEGFLCALTCYGKKARTDSAAAAITSRDRDQSLCPHLQFLCRPYFSSDPRAPGSRALLLLVALVGLISIFSIVHRPLAECPIPSLERLHCSSLQSCQGASFALGKSILGNHIKRALC